MLAKVGYERVQEIENPELATKRTRVLYKLKGYPDDWIEKRIRGIAIREELTDEWQKRGAKKDKDYEILTSEISKATFGVTPNQYKKLKGLKRENLRDYMDDFELIFTILGERSTTEIHRTKNSKGIPKLKKDAKIVFKPISFKPLLFVRFMLLIVMVKVRYLYYKIVAHLY